MHHIHKNPYRVSIWRMIIMTIKQLGGGNNDSYSVCKKTVL